MRDGKMKQPAMEELIRPDPHPLDYDWRFTDETSMRIADRFFQGDYVLILGCPSIALHGHQHLPKISKYASVYFSSGAWRGLKGEDIYIISSGSVGARRLPAGTPNTYTLVKFEESRVKVVMRKLLPIKEEAPPVFEIELPVQPQ